MPHTATAPAPGPRERLKELLIEKFGSLRCRHVYGAPIAFRGRLFLRCVECGQKTEDFVVYDQLRGGR